MIGLSVTDMQCEAMFASELQQSDALTRDVVAEVISCTVGRIGIAGCVGRMAQEFGDHPEAAAERMRWVRQLADEFFAARASSGKTGRVSSSGIVAMASA